VALSAANIRVKRSLLLLGLRLLVGAIEAAERKRHIVGQPLQQFGKFRDEGVLLGGHEQHHAERLTADEQWKRRARFRPVAVNDLVERAALRFAEEIVVDASLP